jgi:hypothetical protein
MIIILIIIYFKVNEEGNYKNPINEEEEGKLQRLNCMNICAIY